MPFSKSRLHTRTPAFAGRTSTSGSTWRPSSSSNSIEMLPAGAPDAFRLSTQYTLPPAPMKRESFSRDPSLMCLVRDTYTVSYRIGPAYRHPSCTVVAASSSRSSSIMSKSH